MNGAPDEQNEVGKTVDDLQEVDNDEQVVEIRSTEHLDGNRTEIQADMSKGKIEVVECWVKCDDLMETEVAIRAR